MSKDAALAFLHEVAKNAELQRKLITFAKEQGFEFGADELTDAELHGVAGGSTLGGTLDTLADAAKSQYDEAKALFQKTMAVVADHEERARQAANKT